jgi:hypothetical protein
MRRLSGRCWRASEITHIDDRPNGPAGKILRRELRDTPSGALERMKSMSSRKGGRGFPRESRSRVRTRRTEVTPSG